MECSTSQSVCYIIPISVTRDQCERSFTVVVCERLKFGVNRVNVVETF